MATTLTLMINGTRRTVVSDPDRSLLEVLREDLKLVGAKYGCGEGACGACTVLLDGVPTVSCRTSVAEAAGRAITTIEGLANGDRLHPVQQAFLDEGASQCGYCTPGMILAAVALLDRHPNPTDAQIVEAMDGNICRCNGYTRILNAIRRAAA